MTFIGPLFVIAMCGAVIGAGMQVNIAMSMLSTESIDSPNFVVRYVYRLCLFCMTLFISLVTSPLVLIGPLSGLVEAAKSTGFAGPWLFAFCLPLAILLFLLDLRFIRRCDARISAGRSAFLRKTKSKSREH